MFTVSTPCFLSFQTFKRVFFLCKSLVLDGWGGGGGGGGGGGNVQLCPVKKNAQ